jgi:hypothetical protein
VGFGWLTRLRSPFLKIFWADISKNLKFFCVGLKTDRQGRGGPAADAAAITTLRERRESLDRASCSILLVGHPA